MERKISLSDLRKAVDDAYEAYKSNKEGEVDPRLEGVDADKFGISVVLPDGTVINKGDTDIMSPMGAIYKVPLVSLLFAQAPVCEVMEKSGSCPMHKVEKKPHGLGAGGIRAFSALEPTGDADSKWNFFENRMIDMMGSAPALDDKLYEAMKKEAADKKVVDELAADGFYLYDDAASSVDLVLRAKAMTASTEQLAKMGATVAADGVNPVTGTEVFDGKYTQNIVGFMAAKGPHKMNLPWLVMTGIPAKRSFGGAMLGIIPGTMAIAAYGPRLNAAGVSVKAAMAIRDIAVKLGLSVFASSHVKFVNE